jgi:hypothetical protein
VAEHVSYVTSMFATQRACLLCEGTIERTFERGCLAKEHGGGVNTRARGLAGILKSQRCSTFLKKVAVESTFENACLEAEDS